VLRHADGYGIHLSPGDMTLSGPLVINSENTGIFASTAASFTAEAAVNITSQGASSIVGISDCRLEFQGPLNIVNTGGQEFELASSSIVLAYAMYGAAVNCDAASNITLPELGSLLTLRRAVRNFLICE
jgi:hypothetical protein